MKPILFFDTETPSVPLWKEPSDHPDQPHIIQLAALLVDASTRELIEFMDVLIKPDGWSWLPEGPAFEKHGITFERAMAEGIPEADAVDQFLGLYAKCGLRVAHSINFDNRIMRIALKRHRPDAIPDDEWKDKSRYHCTLAAHSKAHGVKFTTLQDAYQFHFGRQFEGAHTALPDTKACMSIYFAALDAEKAAA